MLSARNAILVAIAVFALSIIAGTISLLAPPDSNGNAADSYGTRGDGYRAAYELLTSFGIKTQRSIAPPSPDLPTNSTLVFWSPDRQLVANEPMYLTRLLPWVEKGGRIVIAPEPPHRRGWDPGVMLADREHSGNVWDALELKDGELVQVDFDEESAKASSSETIRQIASESPDARRLRIRRGIQKAVEEQLGVVQNMTFASVPASMSGVLDRLSGRVGQLHVPTGQLSALKLGSDAHEDGTLTCTGPEGDKWTMAAVFTRGQGEICVVGEPMLLLNASLAHADNSIFVYDLLAGGGRTVVFDEFYHGLSVRGNPLWLLTQSGYATVMASVAVLVAIEIWRRGRMIGPPLEMASKSRRNIVEYIEAMARFLNRGRWSRPFLLEEVRSGTLRTIGERLGLSHAVRDPEAIAAAMSRRSPGEADEFRGAIRQLDAALARHPTCSEIEAVRAIQRISRCL